jgi:hypothetical protein
MRHCARRSGTWLVWVSLRTTSPKSSGAPRKTLRKRFRDELDRGVAEANAIVSGCLFAAVKAGNIAAMIFWMKTRARWRERPPTDGPDGDADAGSTSEVLVLPDNNRDPELTQVLQEAKKKYFAGKHRRKRG